MKFDQFSTFFSELNTKSTMYDTSELADNAKSSGKVTRVLVIYTGGTIGMKKDINGGYTVVPNYFAGALKRLPMLYDDEFVTNTTNEMDSEKPYPYSEYPELVMPISRMGNRILYYIKEHDPILDSSNMSMEHWIQIGKDIKEHYHYFDSFVVLHGTDTMAYTASALSYMLENLNKTVVLTGSQIPIFEQRNDARSNLIGALEVAGHFVIPEVTIFFNNKLLRGNRSQKVSAQKLNGFESPNLPPLGKLGIDIKMNWEAILSKNSMAPFHLHEEMNVNVGVLRLFPGINAQLVKAFLSPPMEGIVIESFGAGNVPSNRPDLLNSFKEAAERGILILNITQCQKGSVSDAYAAGRVLFDIGVIPGFDMTTEAALTKMAYVLSKSNLTNIEKKNLLYSSLRGEMTFPETHQKFSISENGELIQTVAKTLHIGSSKEMNSIKKSLFPLLLNCAAKPGEIEAITHLVEQGANLNETSGNEGKTCLHVACAEGHLDVVKYLIQNGSSIYMKDRKNRTPLFDAISNNKAMVVDLLLEVGFHLDPNDNEVTRELCDAAAKNDIDRLRLWTKCNVNMNNSDKDGRTPLHMAVMHENVEAVRYLIYEIKVDIDKKDSFGYTPLSKAQEIQSHQILNMILSNSSQISNVDNLNALIEQQFERKDKLFNTIKTRNFIDCKMS